MTDSAGERAPAGASLADLVAVMDRLRRDCPWDARQTHRTLVEYLLEETHETIEAIETDDDDGLREELGDLLLQVVFHARIAAERSGGWGIDDVIADIVAKLVRRHPHVFGAESEFAHLAGPGATDAETLTRNWTAIKAAEKARESALAGVPATLPALSWAQKSWRRAGEAGLDVAVPEQPAVSDAAALGDLLLAAVVTAETRGWDAEAALRERVRRLHDEVEALERPEGVVGERPGSGTTAGG